MGEHGTGRSADRWAAFRFSVIGPLLAAPPRPGELAAALGRLSETSWRHPITGEAVRFGVSTLERWYYAARNAGVDPVGKLRRRRRCDAGRVRRVSSALALAIEKQHREHPGWSYRLHVDNLEVVVKTEPDLGPLPSYATLLRYMKSRGLMRDPRRRRRTPGAERAARRLERLEVRSFESDHVNALWHADFHHGSRHVLTTRGEWKKPILLGVLDDRSRLACHLQWYFEETAETFVHGLVQAIQKRGLPRSLMTDNGSPMLAAEVTRGLTVLGIVHETTLPDSPYQNGKQESLWATVEGRLMAMLEGVAEPTLELLNEATCAWSELDYNRRVHSELGTTPLARWLAGPEVGRPAPSSDDLRQAFRAETMRIQRRSDGTIRLAGRRFEVPGRFRLLSRLHVRWARWDLRSIDLVDPGSGTILCPLYPLDRSRHADGRRRRREDAPLGIEATPAPSGVAPLLRQLLEEYAATGLPPAYLPMTDPEHDREEPES
jgi:transposase InsO family protein